MATPSYLDRQLGDLLDLVASRDPAPGGGAVAALSLALAAGLVAMSARLSERQVPDSALLVAEADRIRLRGPQLADDDGEAYGAVLAAYGAVRSSDSPDARQAIAAALDRAARVPLEIAALGARTAELAARLAVEGNPRLRGDSTTAVFVAEAAVRSARQLVRINVAEGDGDDALVRAADGHVRTAAAAAVRSLRGAA
jgi:formiminotetrahydrofolate cyclodeaminase